MARPKNWVKLWVSWLTTPAHLELSEGAFGLGPLLMLLATWDGEYGSGGWLLSEDGKPFDRKALARATHRESRTRLDAQLTELVRCGTLTVRADGALGFAKFGRWQETKSAKYMRTVRSQSTNSGSNGESNSGPQTLDVRRSSPSENSPVVPTGDQSPNPLVAHVLAEMRVAVRELEPDSRGPRDTEANRKLVAKATKAHDLDEALWTHAIRAQLENVRPDRTKWTYLSLSTICRPENMARLLDAPAPKRAPAPGGNSLLSIAEIRAREAEEDARAAAK